MEQLADRRGGWIFRPGIETTMAKAFAAIEEDLRTQYPIAYTSDRPSSGFRHLRVAAKDLRCTPGRGTTGLERDAKQNRRQHTY
jgi:hypothetical protein